MNREDNKRMPLANGGAPHTNDVMDQVRVIVNDADPLSTVRAGSDKSALLMGLMTAVCRPSLPLAPVLLVRAPEISGSGTGMGLAIRAISIVCGFEPRPMTPGGDRRELEKRLASDLLSGRHVGARVLGRNRMATLSSTSFIGVTGNGLAIFEGLARRFVVSEQDARCENPRSAAARPTTRRKTGAAGQRPCERNLAHARSQWKTRYAGIHFTSVYGHRRMAR
jgi:hypothetical protein